MPLFFWMLLMLAELKFVQGAVGKKDFLPALTHFVIEGGTVRGYNGTLALCTPIPFDIQCKPKAEPLVKAIANCTETVQLSMTAAGRLSVRSGKFKAFVDCSPADTVPHVLPEGDALELNGEALLQALKTLQPFIGDDASRPWTNGVLFRGCSAYATNNVTLIEYWVGTEFPRVMNIPRVTIKEMLRINEAPTHAQHTENSLTLHYTNGRWIRTQLLETEWPDLARILDRESNATPLNELIFAGVDVVKPFVDKMGRILFRKGSIQTHESEEEGAAYAIDDFNVEGAYNIDMLNLLKGVATKVDFSSYPDPCMFFGERVRGAIIGMRTL